MKTLMVPPEKLRLPFPPDERQVTEMTAQLHAVGWVGAPVVAVASGDSYQALTGSSRVEAAREAHLVEIPVAVLDEDEATACRSSPGWSAARDAPTDTSEIESTLRTAGMDDVARIIGEDTGTNL
jgi:hypothetical protein